MELVCIPIHECLSFYGIHVSVNIQSSHGSVMGYGRKISCCTKNPQKKRLTGLDHPSIFHKVPLTLEINRHILRCLGCPSLPPKRIGHLGSNDTILRFGEPGSLLGGSSQLVSG